MTLNKLDNIHGLTDSAGRPLRFSQTHRLRHTRATELLNDGVPIHVVQRYLGHASPGNDTALRCDAGCQSGIRVPATQKKIGAHGTDVAISPPSDIYDMTQLAARTDRILPNGVCLLPPLKTCDKGNACLSCGHFATDTTHLDELVDQRAKTVALIDVRREQYRRRSGRELTDDNVWIHERRREIASLDAIIERLHTETGVAKQGSSVGGAGTSNRLPPLLQIKPAVATNLPCAKLTPPAAPDETTPSAAVGQRPPGPGEVPRIRVQGQAPRHRAGHQTPAQGQRSHQHLDRRRPRRRATQDRLQTR